MIGVAGWLPLVSIAVLAVVVIVTLALAGCIAGCRLSLLSVFAPPAPSGLGAAPPPRRGRWGGRTSLAVDCSTGWVL